MQTPMTVAQLRAALADLPQDARVIVDGYEGGYDDVGKVTIIPVAIGRTSAYCGAHDDPSSLGPEWGEPSYPIESCVLLSA